MDAQQAATMAEQHLDSTAEIIEQLANENRRLERELGLLDLVGESEGPQPIEEPPFSYGGATALDIARQLFRQFIREYPHGSPEPINAMVMGLLGLAWSAAVKPALKPRRGAPYDGRFEWCGAFVARCYCALLHDIRRRHLASTWRLWSWSKGNARRLRPEDIRAGDIVVVGRVPGFKGARRWGAHIALVEEVHPDGLATIEGNARGTFPDGSTGEGVVRQLRPFAHSNPRVYRVLYGVRPLPEDFIPEKEAV